MESVAEIRQEIGCLTLDVKDQSAEDAIQYIINIWHINYLNEGLCNQLIIREEKKLVLQEVPPNASGSGKTKRTGRCTTAPSRALFRECVPSRVPTPLCASRPRARSRRPLRRATSGRSYLWPSAAPIELQRELLCGVLYIINTKYNRHDQRATAKSSSSSCRLEFRIENTRTSHLMQKQVNNQRPIKKKKRTGKSHLLEQTARMRV